MKNITLPLLLGTLVAGGSLGAAPFDSSRVSEDTKWVAHLDVDGFKASSLGEMLIDTAKAEIAKMNDSNVSIDVQGLINEIHSITAYGTTFEDHPENNSVLVVQAGPRAQAVIDGYLASQELANDGKVPFKTVSGKNFPTYLISNQVYLTFPRKDLIVISKEFTQVERALSVIEGRLPKIAKNNPLLDSSEARGFFFVASANGLNLLKNVPPQARLLQKATGIQVALGETGGNLATRVTLVTADAETSSQMRRIVEGMLALASFAQTEDQNLNTLVQSIAVKESVNSVTIGLSYPVAAAKKLLIAAMSDDRPSRPTTKGQPAAESAVTDAIGGERLKINYVDASSDNGNMARNATDASPTTHWSAVGRQQWIRCELDSPSLVREVQIAWVKGNERKNRFIIQTSPDGTKWTRLLSKVSSGDSEALESYNVTDTATRWIRIQNMGTDSKSLTEISDLRIFGEPNVALATSPEAVSTAHGK